MTSSASPISDGKILSNVKSAQKYTFPTQQPNYRLQLPGYLCFKCTKVHLLYTQPRVLDRVNLEACQPWTGYEMIYSTYQSLRTDIRELPLAQQFPKRASASLKIETAFTGRALGHASTSIHSISFVTLLVTLQLPKVVPRQKCRLMWTSD
jgi:hypothetical protein